jgi:hypothetical protein
VHVINLILLDKSLHRLYVSIALCLCAILENVITFQLNIVHALDLLINLFKLPIDLDTEVHLLSQCAACLDVGEPEVLVNFLSTIKLTLLHTMLNGIVNGFIVKDAR